MSSMVQQLCPVNLAIKLLRKPFYSDSILLKLLFQSQPGQFVNLLVAETGEGPLLRRPFSISRIEKDSIELIFHVVGIGTNLLSRKQSEIGSMLSVRLVSHSVEMRNMTLLCLLQVESALPRFLF